MLRLSVWLALGLIVAGAARAEPAAVRLRWLGVAGFSIEAAGGVLLHDPFLSRPGLLRTLFFRYEPDADVLEPLMAAGGPAPELARARLVLVGHSHWDHLGDVAWLASRSGAAVAGSITSAVIARAYGLAPERARPVRPGDRLREGPFEIEVVESRHARVLAGRVPFQGEVTQPPEAPIHAVSFKMGGALGYLVTHRPSGLRIFHLSSAALHPPALAALAEREKRVDVLLAPPRGRDADYAQRLVSALRPGLVVPHHYDDFFRPLDHPEAAAAVDAEDLAACEHELREAAAAADVALEVRHLALFEALVLSAEH